MLEPTTIDDFIGYDKAKAKGEITKVLMSSWQGKVKL